MFVNNKMPNLTFLIVLSSLKENLRIGWWRFFNLSELNFVDGSFSCGPVIVLTQSRYEAVGTVITETNNVCSCGVAPVGQKKQGNYFHMHVILKYNFQICKNTSPLSRCLDGCLFAVLNVGKFTAIRVLQITCCLNVAGVIGI